MDRRRFFKGTIAAGISALMLPSSSGQVVPSIQLAKRAHPGGYGPLRPTPANNTGEVMLEVPQGFEYNVFGRTGSLMADGRLTPPRHDGMAAFQDDLGMIRLVRNHEVDFKKPRTALDVKSAYDPTTGGGTTTLVIDPETRLPVKDFLSLSGTHRNCSGGPTPWNTWLSCEETVKGISSGFERDHGYVFEVPAGADAPVSASPIREMGRFFHESAAVEPSSGFVYMTEDRKSCGFYRFKPQKLGNLFGGGTLQMLAVTDAENYDTRSNQPTGVTLPVEWVDIPDPDPSDAESNSHAVYDQGKERGGARFKRLEGCCYRSGRIIFTSTNGGDAGRGQVWEYRPTSFDRGRLRLLFESSGKKELDFPDNVSARRSGGLILCEDGSGDSYLRGVGSDGEVFDFARNVVEGFESKEFAGATFSLDGQILFVNIQTPGLTFAIWGDWQSGTI